MILILYGLLVLGGGALLLIVVDTIFPVKDDPIERDDL